MPGKNRKDWFDMDESEYRVSQLCRVLGNPKAFHILRVIQRRGEATPTELSKRVNRTVSTVCAHLKSLKETHLVRYLKTEGNTVYRIKPSGLPRVQKALEALVKEIRTMEK